MRCVLQFVSYHAQVFRACKDDPVDRHVDRFALVRVRKDFTRVGVGRREIPGNSGPQFAVVDNDPVIPVDSGDQGSSEHLRHYGPNAVLKSFGDLPDVCREGSEIVLEYPVRVLRYMSYFAADEHAPDITRYPEVDFLADDQRFGTHDRFRLDVAFDQSPAQVLKVAVRRGRNIRFPRDGDRDEYRRGGRRWTRRRGRAGS